MLGSSGGAGRSTKKHNYQYGVWLVLPVLPCDDSKPEAALLCVLNSAIRYECTERRAQTGLAGGRTEGPLRLSCRTLGAGMRKHMVRTRVKFPFAEM